MFDPLDHVVDNYEIVPPAKGPVAYENRTADAANDLHNFEPPDLGPEYSLLKAAVQLEEVR